MSRVHEDEMIMMVMEVRAFGVTHTITTPDDLTIHEFLENCFKLALSVGFSAESWQKAIDEEAGCDDD